jgi:hypothetical protein
VTTKTIHDLLEGHPSFQYEAAKKAGYTDDEIAEFLSSQPIEDAFTHIEVPLTARLEGFAKKHPFCFWTSISTLSIILICLIIKCLFILLKSFLYHIALSIKSGINDANKNL